MNRDNNSNHRGSSKPNHRPFRSILYEMVDDSSTDSIISWSESGKSFIVWNESEFCRDVLPRFLLLKEMSLFNFRLTNLGFKKVEESEQWEYANDYFVRGKPELTPPTPLKMKTPPHVVRERERLLALRKNRFQGLGS